jgi:hypothetical protein
VAGEDMQMRVRSVAHESVGEGGFADAGLAADQDKAALTIAYSSQAIVQQGEFAITPEEVRCACSARAHVIPGAEEADSPMHRL